ncbi:MAG: ShlB/FhaC/HecB family hemolysin secretion/activation protein [Xenococcaceae cyanobacterium]
MSNTFLTNLKQALLLGSDRFNIESESTDYEFTYRQPLIQKPTQDLAIGIIFSRKDSKTTLGGNSFQLSRGTEIDGQTHISALRFFQEYTTRNAKQVFAVRSQFSLGIDAFDSTTNDGDLPDSQFFSWRGQAQYLRLLTPDLTLVLRSDLQLADRSLVSVEQFSLGGVYSVRGYRQDILLGDNGWFNSAEIRTTIVRIPAWETSLQIAPFLDIGKVWNTDKFGDTDNVDLDLDTNTLVSTGIGLRLQVSDRFAARLDWGIPLVDLETNGDTLQEDGVYFSLELQAF